MSLETIGCDIPVVSLNGTTHYEELIKKIKDENYKGTVVLSLDNDYWGNFYGTLLKDKLQEINIKTINYPFTHTYKDINEALVKDKNSLITSLNMLTQVLTIKKQQKNENLEVSAKENDSLEL